MSNEQLAFGPLPSVFAVGADPWCTASDPVWDGVDFSACFRARYLNGIVPLVFLSLSVLSLVVIALFHLTARLQKPAPHIPLASASRRRLSRSHSRGADSVDYEQISTKGPQAIAEAENEVLLSVVSSQSPDLALKDILKLGFGPSTASSSAIDDDEDGGRTKRVAADWRTYLRALRGTKKDIVNVFGSVAVTIGVVVKAVQEQDDVGSRWLFILVAAWAYTVVLSLAKLAISLSSKVYQIQHGSTHRVSPYYTLLEATIIPWFFVFTIISFFEFRSILLSYLASETSGAHLRHESIVFVFSLILTCVETFAPRPSRFASRASPVPGQADTQGLPPTQEMHASLFGIASFSYMDSFIWKHTFTSAKLSLDAVPDLRPDDKTARVLLGYRRDLQLLGSVSNKWGLTKRLLWHFRREIAQQQLFAYFRVMLIPIQPLMLKQLLGFISERKRGGTTPTHVALLYAAGMFASTVLGSMAAGQCLFMGRRLCIRLRSIIVGEVFTKALRRKDLAGSSSQTASTGKDGETVDAAAETEEQKEQASSGKIYNLVSVDTFRLSEIAAYLHFAWPELPLTIAIAIFLLFRVLGWSAAAGLVTLLMLMPVQTQISKLFFSYQVKLLAAADSRIALSSEVIQNIRVVKYFAWEKAFLDRINVARERELQLVWSRAITIILGGVLTFGGPVCVSVATFVVHTKVLHRDLTAETAFTALSLFNILRGPLEEFTGTLVALVSAYVSLQRIDEFLQEEETAKFTNIRAPASASDPVVGFTNATFTWSGEDLARDDPTLFRIRDLNLNFPVGKLSIIVGSVGSGKSTLLLSLLGETNKLAGTAFLPSPVVRSTSADPAILTDTTAYASQSPFLLSDTIRQNILFGSPYNERRYEAVIEACALAQDLKQFELGDATEVGERGTVCSGGQKARISLARAMYSPARTILADDVLSALDAHTTSHIFRMCLKGKLMRHRTCILVTHAVDTVMPGAAYVVSLDNGNVVSAGPPGESTILPAKNDDGEESLQPPTSADALASSITIESLAAGVPDEILVAKVAEEQRLRQDKNKLIQEEKQSVGMVSLDVYFAYFSALGGWTPVLLIIGLFGLAQLADIAISVALRYWAQAYDIVSPSLQTSLHQAHLFLPQRLGVDFASAQSVVVSFGTGNATTDKWLRLYVVAVLFNITLSTCRNAYLMARGLRASRTLHADLLAKLLGAPTRFFDSTPQGRILNRLSKDMETIDQDVARVSTYFLFEIFAVCGILLSITTVMPWFLLAAAGISLIYALIGICYVKSSRELKRTESTTKSPIFSLFGESLNGVTTIRAYGDSSRFMKHIFTFLDINNRPFFALWQANRWLSVRVDAAGATVVFATAVVVLLAKNMDAALAGFVLSFAMNFNERMLWVIRVWSEMELNMNSVERVKEYLEINQESKTHAINPPAAWPSREGSISVEGLTCSYAPDLPPVLKDVSFTVLPREKVGIVGRTGSGKSTLGLSFFRFIEPSSGRIVIDGLDINKLPLPELRRRLTIVGQDTALFEASVRFNLDPFEEYEDAELWDALRRVGLARPLATPSASKAPSRVQSSRNLALQDDGGSENTFIDESERYLVDSLDTSVAQGGKNFSMGQKQLISLARGLLKLRSSSILLLDESTASLDHATDERIQKTIREEMSDATILCVAHRLRTIADLDKILVLGDGRVLEYDSPWALLDKPDSVYADLCRKSGEYDLLVEMAHRKRDSVQK